MKKIGIIILLIAAIAGLSIAFMGNGTEDGENASYLRVHIRANSNSETDQAVKYRKIAQKPVKTGRDGMKTTFNAS